MSNLVMQPTILTDAQPARVLIADDQPAVLDALRLLLKREGYQIETVNSPAAVLATLASGPFDALLMDMNTPVTPLPARKASTLWLQSNRLIRRCPLW